MVKILTSIKKCLPHLSMGNIKCNFFGTVCHFLIAVKVQSYWLSTVASVVMLTEEWRTYKIKQSVSIFVFILFVKAILENNYL